MQKISQDVQECIKAIQTNDPSVVERLRLINLYEETAPLYMVVNLRHWEGLQYAIHHTNHIEILLKSACCTQWYPAIDVLLPKATPEEIREAAIACADDKTLDVLQELSKHCNDLKDCVLPACFRRSQSVLHFLAQRGEAQYMCNKLKNINRDNDPYKLSFIYGEKIWSALDFLRRETTRWELENVTQNCGTSPKNKKI